MIHRILAQKTVIKYIAIGATAYLIELTALLLFVDVLKFSTSLAVAISFWVGFIAAFFLQKVVVFKTDTAAKNSFTKQAVYYSLLVAFNYCFTLVFVPLLAKYIDLVVARTIILGLTTLWNFLFYKRVIFT